MSLFHSPQSSSKARVGAGPAAGFDAQRSGTALSCCSFGKSAASNGSNSYTQSILAPQALISHRRSETANGQGGGICMIFVGRLAHHSLRHRVDTPCTCTHARQRNATQRNATQPNATQRTHPSTLTRTHTHRQRDTHSHRDTHTHRDAHAHTRRHRLRHTHTHTNKQTHTHTLDLAESQGRLL